MTAIVAMALGQEPIEDPKPTEVSTGNFLLPSMVRIILYFELWIYFLFILTRLNSPAV